MDIQTIELSKPLWSQTLQKLRHDFYHLPEYVNLEAKRTKTTAEAILITDDENIFFLPYLWRRCDDLFDGELVTQEVFDVVSPYGYPGFLLNEAATNTPEFLGKAIDNLTQVWRDRQICSAFLRLHPILNADVNNLVNNEYVKINGETISVNLKLDDSEIWHLTRPEHRTKINRCKRNGFTAKIVSFKQNIRLFNEIYEETMERVEAAKVYFFGEEYFREIADSLGEKLHLCIVELNEEVACAGLFAECCGIIQYHLGGTRTSFLKQAPSTLMFDYVRFWAKERGNEVLHLGGGLGGSQDSLHHFKAGFSKQRHDFLTIRLIVDEKKYHHLVKIRAKSLNTQPEELLKSGFFPAYRSSC